MKATTLAILALFLSAAAFAQTATPTPTPTRTPTPTLTPVVPPFTPAPKADVSGYHGKTIYGPLWVGGPESHSATEYHAGPATFDNTTTLDVAAFNSATGGSLSLSGAVSATTAAFDTLTVNDFTADDIGAASVTASGFVSAASASIGAASISGNVDIAGAFRVRGVSLFDGRMDLGNASNDLITVRGTLQANNDARLYGNRTTVGNSSSDELIVGASATLSNVHRLTIAGGGKIVSATNAIVVMLTAQQYASNGNWQNTINSVVASNAFTSPASATILLPIPAKINGATTVIAGITIFVGGSSGTQFIELVEIRRNSPSAGTDQLIQTYGSKIGDSPGLKQAQLIASDFPIDEDWVYYLRLDCEGVSSAGQIFINAIKVEAYTE